MYVPGMLLQAAMNAVGLVEGRYRDTGKDANQ
jgi:hypothetical protein